MCPPGSVRFWPTVAAPDTTTPDEAFDVSGVVIRAAGTFGWSLDTADHTLSLTYTPTPVPEPGTLALTALAGLG